jgi:hypothetical protein
MTSCNVIILFVHLVLLVKLTLFLIIIIIPMFKMAISNEMIMLTIIVAYSLGR